jgi:restriction endonuclease S subunit
MGKKAKEHRKKVAKRNANIKQQEKKMEKVWMTAMEEQLNKMREQFEKTSGDTENVEDGVVKETENSETTSLDYDKVLEDSTKVDVAGFHNVTEND